jgi:hypothetical protein
MGRKPETRRLCKRHWYYEGPKRTKALDMLFAEAKPHSVTVDPVSLTEIRIEAAYGYHFDVNGLHEYVCGSASEALERIKGATFAMCDPTCEWWFR